jgi:hypothetical protein
MSNKKTTNELLISINDNLGLLSEAQEDFTKKYQVSPISHDESIAAFRRRLKIKQITEGKKLAAYNRVLSNCTQDTVEQCRCGEKHMGIKFTDEYGTVLEENMCPRTWYIKLVRMALEEGHGTKFTKTNPIKGFMRYYKNGK